MEKVGDIIDSFIEAIKSIPDKIKEIFSGDGILSHLGFGNSSDKSSKGKTEKNTSTTVFKGKDKVSGIAKNVVKKVSEIPTETNTTMEGNDQASGKMQAVKSRAEALNGQLSTVKITAEDKTGSVFSSIASKISSLATKARNIVVGSGASGLNIPTAADGKNIYGSQAKPKRGRLGPKGKGGMTLTGELGPELV